MTPRFDAVRVRRLVRSEALLLGLGASVVFWCSALLTHHAATPDTAYFNHLADAFLHGRLHLANPPATHDLTEHAGRWYVPFPPLAAILMMPFVAVLGLHRLNTVAFAAGLGGVDVALLVALLRRLDRNAIVRVSPSVRRWLVLVYGLGSVHWYMATQGSVWFLGHLAAAVFVLASLNFAASDRAVPAGVALGIASLGRPTTLLMAPLVLGVVLAARRERASWRDLLTPRVLRVGAQLSLPGVFFAMALLTYNRLRFGRFTEFGYSGENVAPNLAPDLEQFGQFNVHFIRHNIWAMLLAGPKWVAERGTLEPDPDGMSMLLTTPALVYAFRAARRVPLTLWCWVAVACMAVPLLTYYNTGWWQFGYRFSLDFFPALIVLMAIGLANRITWQFRVLAVAGVLVNLWGVAWFN